MDLFFNKKGLPTLSASTIKIHFDGNSLIYGAEAFVDGEEIPQYLANRVMADPMFDGSGLSVSSFGISGQRWDAMMNARDDIVSAIEPNVRNILYVWESTNQIASFPNGTTVQLAIDTVILRMQDYLDTMHSEIETLKQSAPNTSLEIYKIETIPRAQSYGMGSIANFNLALTGVDDYVRNNFRSMGLSGIVEVRYPGGIEDTTNSEYFYNQVHLNAAGQDLVSMYILQHIRSLGA